MSIPFPGGTALSRLSVYDDAAGDGVRGGTPHLHLVSTEAYIVTSGTGRLETISREGFRSTELRAGSVVWFGAGTVHRAVTDGDLELVVLMANAGLPEAGDAVIAFPLDALRDAARYRELTALPTLDAADPTGRAAASRRRDLAVEGFLALRQAAEAGDNSLLEATYQAAAALVSERVPEWRELWEERVAGDGRRTQSLLTALEQGECEQLGTHAPVEGPVLDGERLGMCGVLRVYDLH